MNRDTLYSAAVFDLDAGPVTITLPDAGNPLLRAGADAADLASKRTMPVSAGLNWIALVLEGNSNSRHVFDCTCREEWSRR
jgi:hypothetical protein